MTVPTVELDPGIRYLTATAVSGSFVAKLNTDALRNRRFDSPVVVITPSIKLNIYLCPASYSLSALVISAVLHQQRTL